jgi:hypothetical protein
MTLPQPDKNSTHSPLNVIPPPEININAPSTKVVTKRSNTVKQSISPLSSAIKQLEKQEKAKLAKETASKRVVSFGNVTFT